MSFKVSYIVPTRNKARWVERAALSYINQTYLGDMEVVFFDQSSTDGTLEILQRLVREYKGPNEIRVLKCPESEWKGMPMGMNADLEWVHKQIRGDVILYSNADDYAMPDRTTRVVEYFEKYNPSWVGTKQRFEYPDGTVKGETIFENQRSRWIDMTEAFQYQIASSGSVAWHRDLWNKFGPMKGVEQCDIVLPMMSFFQRGMYFIDETLHVYVFHGSSDNLGLGGQMLGAKNESEQLQASELNLFNLVRNWSNLADRISKGQYRVHTALANGLAERILDLSREWARVREEMTIKKIKPKGMGLGAA